MELIWKTFTEWFRELLVNGIISNLDGLFDAVNARVSEIAGQVGATPQAWNGGIFNMIRALSDNLVLPVAGVVLTFVMTLELLSIIAEKNNLADVDTWMFFKWIFKTACAVLIVSNTWNIIMGVFEAAGSLVGGAARIVNAGTALTLEEHIAGLEAGLWDLEIPALLGLWLESFLIGITMWVLSICIFVITYGRMIEIYLTTSLAPIPMAAALSRESGGMGQNYLRSLAALGFQGFLILVCVAIYAVLIQNLVIGSSLSAAMWSALGYTVLLCFSLFKTGSLAKAIFGAR